MLGQPGSRDLRIMKQTGLIFFLVLLGGAVRLWLGVLCHPALAQPDQHAWGLLLDEAYTIGFRSDQLLHLPHEGGTGLLSVLALLIRPFCDSSLTALSYSGLILDTLVRGLQAAAMVAIFGRCAGIAFATWSVFALPVLLPWGAMSVSLHHLGSVWPFLFLWATHSGDVRRAGIVTALAMLWSYNGMVLLLPLLGLGLRTRRLWIAFSPVLVAIVVLVLIRMTPSLGFQLEDMPMWSIRSVELREPEAPRLLRMTEVWWRHLPQATAAPAFGGAPAWWLGAPWLFGVAVGISVGLWRSASRPTVLLGVGVTILYILIYAISPFSDLPTKHDYFTFRHLTWVLPLLAGLALAGWSQLRSASIVALIASAGSAFALWAGPLERAELVQPDSVGWLIGRKLGDQPERVAAIAAHQAELLEGVGWGTAEAILRFGYHTDPPQLIALRALVERYPPLDRPHVDAGVRRALAGSRMPNILTSLWQEGWQASIEITRGAVVLKEACCLSFYTNGTAVFNPSGGPLVIVVSGPGRVDLHGEDLTLSALVPEHPILIQLPAIKAGSRLIIEFNDDGNTPEGQDQNIRVWWIGAP